MIDRRELAKKITMLESTRTEDIGAIWKLLEAAASKKAHSHVLGIFGSPGVGKSSFINIFAEHMAKQNLQIAILTIDPSSPVTGGSLLGDKTRMQNLLAYPNIFIRPSPSGISAGAIAPTTAEVCLLLNSYSFDYILIETVGSGQNDIEVSKIADLNFLLIQPSEGDFVQGLKKGALEVADYILVSKSDGGLKALAESTARDYQSSIELSLHDERKKEVLNISSIDGSGIQDLWQKVQADYTGKKLTDGYARRNRYIIQKLLRKKILEQLDTNPELVTFAQSLNDASSNGLSESLKKLSTLEFSLKLKK
jgi:LAO/AO transport system kinase